MVATVIMLTLVHKRLRLQRYREIREYYEEQMKYVLRPLRSLCAALLTRVQPTQIVSCITCRSC